MLRHKFVQFSFVDVFGVQRSKLVPASRFEEMARSGAGFAGFACHLDMDPTQGDLLAVPDMSTLTVLPWNRDVAWVACDLQWEGAELAHGPRNTLRRTLAKLKEDHGLQMKTGVECEFFLLRDGVVDPRDRSKKPCYDAHALMRYYDVIAELLDAMEGLGWGPYQADHEDANGQFEINWDYDDALVTADRVVFFKYMARSIAEKHGLTATFMPKPFADLTGSGCHAHVSLHDSTGKNLGLNDRFLAGVLHEAAALAAIANPTVNSYKRLRAVATSSGATWSPNTVCWAGNNRTVMVRVPDDHRFELRLADMAANPYLLPAGIAAAGSSGLVKDLELPPRADCNMYDPHCAMARNVRLTSAKLPLTLRHALDTFNASDAMRVGLGNDAVDAYLRLKYPHCDAADNHLSKWETDNLIDS